MNTTIAPSTLGFLLVASLVHGAAQPSQDKKLVIDESGRKPHVAKKMVIDKVWAGHPVGFCLLTEGRFQYAAYYNADRQMVVASRQLGEDGWIKFMPQTDYKQPPKTGSPASAILGWDSHNYITMALDENGFIHLSGNMHVDNLTYFRSTKPYDITTLVQTKSMTGSLEDRCTYPKFMKNAGGALIFTYRHGSSGNGNQIYNIYNAATQAWSRLLDTPLTDGKGLRNAYILGPQLGPDGWYHISWVWRETFDCSTNHDLSYAKSKNLVDWYTIAGKKIALPITLETSGVIVDPVLEKGGILNGSGRIGFDQKKNAVLAYHKFDANGNNQAYCARAENGAWQIKQLTDWDYRWYFDGGGTIQSELSIGTVQPRKDQYLELHYSHKKYGGGTWLLDDQLNICGTVNKPSQLPSSVGKVQSSFPGMAVKRAYDDAAADGQDVVYLLSWETLPQNRDLPREGDLPEPSDLTLYEIRYERE
ncbi:MAG: BNR repeat-containing protein [Kiritimatiellales bacterium]|nr:BNR repeat-containing protein [Kiritimatiellales bacterium]